MLYDSFSSSGMQISVKYLAKVRSKNEQPDRKPRGKIPAVFLLVMRGKTSDGSVFSLILLLAIAQSNSSLFFCRQFSME